MRDPLMWMRLLGHQTHHLAGDVSTHAVIQSPPGKNHLWVIANLLCLVSQVVGIYTDAVTADQAWAERQKIPLGPRRLQYLLRIDVPEMVKNEREFVDQSDIYIALRVLDNLGRFGNANLLLVKKCVPAVITLR